MADYRAPGIYRQDVFPPPPPILLTGVPVFLGYTHAAPELVNVPQRLTLWPQLKALLGPPADGYLADAVRGFFENDGVLCFVVPLEDAGSPVAELQAGLAANETREDGESRMGDGRFPRGDFGEEAQKPQSSLTNPRSSPRPCDARRCLKRNHRRLTIR